MFRIALHKAPQAARLGVSSVRRAVPRELLLATLGVRLLATLLGGVALALALPRRNPLTAERGWDHEGFSGRTLLDHVGRLGDRWDADWYLDIAEHGYQGGADTAFFPLFPILVSAVSLGVLPLVFAGLLVSLATAVVSGVVLYHVGLDLRLPRRAALLAVALWSMCPAAAVLAGGYPEGLLAALLAGAWLAALRGHGWVCAVLVGLGLLTKPLGVVALPLLFAVRSGTGRSATPQLRAMLEWRSIGGRAAVAAALASLWPAYLWLRFGDPLRFVSAQDHWDRYVTAYGPLQGLWEGCRAAVQALGRLAAEPVGFAADDIANLGDPIGIGMQDLVNAGCIAGLVALGPLVWRRFGWAAGAWVLLAALVPLTSPSTDIPMLSAPRFALIALPAFLAVAVVVTERRLGLAVLTIVASTGGLAVVALAGWQWVG